MRSSLHGTFATLLLLIPVGAIPALAIFGIPQFAPVVASPLHEGPDVDRERREGRSARGPADDLFQDEDDFDSRTAGDDGLRTVDATSGRLGDAVTIPVRHASQNPNADSSGNNSSSEQSFPVQRGSASWADDLPAEPRRTTPSGEGVPPQFEPELRPFTRTSADRSGATVGRKSQSSGTNSESARLSEANNTAAVGGPQGFQRQRETPLERVTPVSHESPAAEPLTWKSAVRQLNDLEIRSFRIEPGRQPTQFIFICSYTPTDSPRVSYRFEAEADEPLKAVEKVLTQITEWQHRR
jgi:hypothetical protein